MSFNPSETQTDLSLLMWRALVDIEIYLQSLVIVINHQYGSGLQYDMQNADLHRVHRVIFQKSNNRWLVGSKAYNQ